MASLTYSFVLFLCNLSGILCYKFRRNVLELSNSMALINALKIILIISVSFFVSFSENIRERIFISELVNLKGYSKFSKLVIVSYPFLSYIFAIYLNIVLMSNRKIIFEFMRRCYEILSRENFDELMKLSSKYGAAVSADTLVVILFQIIATINFTVFASVLTVVLCFPIFVLLMFLGMTRIFGKYFLKLLEDFKHELQRFLEKKFFDSQMCRNLMIKHQQIYDLNQDFNKIFGVQLTMLTCGFAFMLTMHVSSYLTKFNVKLFFEFKI